MELRVRIHTSWVTGTW